MAQAILEHFKQDNVDISTLSNGWILKNELSFDNKRKLASYIYQFGNSQVVLSSGAPEKILENSSKILLRGEEAELSGAIRIEVSKIVHRWHTLANDSSPLATTDYQPNQQWKIWSKTSFLSASSASLIPLAKKSGTHSSLPRSRNQRRHDYRRSC